MRVENFYENINNYKDIYYKTNWDMVGKYIYMYINVIIFGGYINKLCIIS